MMLDALLNSIEIRSGSIFRLNRISNHQYYFIDKILHKGSILLRKQKIRQKARKAPNIFLNLKLYFYILLYIRRASLRVIVAKHLHFGHIPTPSDVDVVVELAYPLHWLGDSQIVSNHNASVISQDADESEVNGDIVILAYNLYYFIVFLLRLWGHVLPRVGLGDYYCLVASGFGEVFVIFVIKAA